MTTIITRASKGSALTWAEGDANIVNLNTDKLEAVNEDTAPMLGGDLDVAQFAIISTNNADITLAPDGTGKITLDGVRWPKISTGSSGAITGTVTSIDDVREPNTITLSNFNGISVGDEITFTGTDVTSAGLIENGSYYIASDLGAGEFEISDGPANPPVAITALGSYTDFNYSVTPSGPGGGSLVGGEVLTYNMDGDLTWTQPPSGGAQTLNELTDVNAAGPSDGQALIYETSTGQWTAQSLPAAGIQSVSEDTAPTLGGNLNVSTHSIVSSSDGNITIAPNGTGKSIINNINYNETPYSLGTAFSGTIAPDVANGNVQTLQINGNITFNGFTNPVAGQSLTLILFIDGNGLTLTSNMLFAGGDKTLSATNSTDIITVYYTGSFYFASISKGFQ